MRQESPSVTKLRDSVQKQCYWVPVSSVVILCVFSLPAFVAELYCQGHARTFNILKVRIVLVFDKLYRVYQKESKCRSVWENVDTMKGVVFQGEAVFQAHRSS